MHPVLQFQSSIKMPIVIVSLQIQASNGVKVSSEYVFYGKSFTYFAASSKLHIRNVVFGGLCALNRFGLLSNKIGPFFTFGTIEKTKPHHHFVKT